MLIVWDFRFHGTQESLECRHLSRTLFVWRLNIDLKVKALDILGIFEREKREKKKSICKPKLTKEATGGGENIESSFSSFRFSIFQKKLFPVVIPIYIRDFRGQISRTRVIFKGEIRRKERRREQNEGKLRSEQRSMPWDELSKMDYLGGGEDEKRLKTDERIQLRARKMPLRFSFYTKPGNRAALQFRN